MFKKARDIIVEQYRLGTRPAEIRKKLRAETSLSSKEIQAMIGELLPEEDKKRAQAIIQEMLKDSGIPEAMARDMLMTGGRTKTIAALRTTIRRRLKKETGLTFADINVMVGLEKGSHHLSEDAMG